MESTASTIDTCNAPVGDTRIIPIDGPLPSVIAYSNDTFKSSLIFTDEELSRFIASVASVVAPVIPVPTSTANMSPTANGSIDVT